MEKIEGIVRQDGSIGEPGHEGLAAALQVKGIKAGDVQLLEAEPSGPGTPRVVVRHGDLVVGWAYQGRTVLEFDGGADVVVPAGRPFYASTNNGDASSVISWDADFSGMLIRLPFRDVFVGMPGPAQPCGAVARAASLIEPAKAFLEASVSSSTEASAVASYAVERLTVEMLTAIFLELGGFTTLDGEEPTLLDKSLAVIRSQAKDQQLDPKLLATIVGVSLRTLHREFQANDHSVAAAIRMQRVANARGLLERPGQAAWPLERIASSAGFSSVVTMTRAFLASGYETPAKCRRMVLRRQRAPRLRLAS
ncbi:helix-turn-helix domain-containing protein [Pseudarthrobacter sp. J75]|uniref:helix-turn-helix domain-containing protein n=1 Tax=unclassified Pseudarthrobacter TaxID=2647000 RepID=UPI002E81C823|nr:MULTISPECIES: helix-turn-helix domain-containing protein [unclassified Pseudarthrobacter]MEE2524192.1 helix-turn-helix domain-containing protein [Pseudarthrobacter sp. J47]MEE2530230.1 helix-turn-helix domain-containing protein [Pseudarthrobacter sp. J75]MEE2568900.1 helix-turn-helix domain-containing protein [Pseudarthrobacter sp. J64]